MKAFAQFIHEELRLSGTPEDIRDICEGTDRYSMYKVGPVLSISVSMTPDFPSLLYFERVALKMLGYCYRFHFF